MNHMRNEWENLDINQLQHLYHENALQLEQKLLHGASWKEVSQQRYEVTELAITIFRRLNPLPLDHPAEHGTRRKP
jgi:hypothetical protein